jgi:hypothetical protein
MRKAEQSFINHKMISLGVKENKHHNEKRKTVPGILSGYFQQNRR